MCLAITLTFQPRRSSITPGITRRPEPLLEFEIPRVGGRVHAVVGRGVMSTAPLNM